MSYGTMRLPQDLNNVTAQAAKAQNAGQSMNNPSQAQGYSTGGQSSPMLKVSQQAMGQAFGQLPFGGIIRLDKYRKVVEGQESWL